MCTRFRGLLRIPPASRDVLEPRPLLQRRVTGPVNSPGIAGDAASGSERRALRSITERPLESGPGPRWIVAVIVLAVLAVAGIAYGLVERSRRAELEHKRVAALVRGDSLTSALAARDSLLETRPTVESLLSILSSPDVASFPLAGSAEARGSLVASSGGAILSASGLPAADSGYTLWHVDDAGVHRVAGLGSAPDGHLLALLEDASFATGWGAIQVAKEDPASEAPGEIVLQYRGFLR